ncbi:MAG: hypothetical protein RLZZ387_5088 [Chloroflexota bacterium]|jgi:serine/threonine protein kinase
MRQVSAITDRLLNITLGHYRLVEVIGHGAMATGYRAHQASLDRFVAVKMLQHNNNTEQIARFKSEARLLALLQHSNILPVHDYGEGDDFFSPGKQTVVVGTALVRKNEGPSAHTVTSEDRTFNSKVIAPGETFRFTFTKAEPFPYDCTLHNGLTGRACPARWR